MPNSPWQQVKDTAFVVMVMAAMAVTIIMTR